MSGCEVAAVVVTCDRPRDLARCLTAIRSQTRRPDQIIVVDNGSGSETTALLADQPDLRVERLERNEGGAGGFARGVAAASKTTAEWLWLMDDDALPAEDALHHLLYETQGARGVGGVVPTVVAPTGEETIGWPTHPRERGTRGGPFLGLLLRADACRGVGPVRTDFVLRFDDNEYCIRLLAAGWEFVAAPAARIWHPMERPIQRVFLGRRFSVAPGPPWKEYYAARNAWLAARIANELNITGVAEARVTSELRSWVDLVVARDRVVERLGMRALGLLDGMRGRAGARVAPGATFGPTLVRFVNSACRGSSTGPARRSPVVR